MLGYLAENGVCLVYEFREGNIAAQTGAVPFLERCRAVCRRIARLRSDSAIYRSDVIRWCQERGVEFTITADQTAGMKEVIMIVRDWRRLWGPKGEETDREVGTAVHLVSKTKEAVRLVVQRWRGPQIQLFEPNGYCYHIIATNRDDLAPEEVVWFHNRWGQVENLIKELKIGFGMEQMSSGDFAANSLRRGRTPSPAWPAVDSSLGRVGGEVFHDPRVSPSCRRVSSNLKTARLLYKAELMTPHQGDPCAQTPERQTLRKRNDQGYLFNAIWPSWEHEQA
jgi:hypothetical protein